MTECSILRNFNHSTCLYNLNSKMDHNFDFLWLCLSRLSTFDGYYNYFYYILTNQEFLTAKTFKYNSRI